jgi:ionotropic kainate glutamate receptor 2
VKLTGLTGEIEFSEGRRTSVKLDILKLKPADLVKVGEWTPENGINLTNPHAFYDVGQFNITLKVVTIEVSYT